jgi:L-asparagine oxygenase
MVQAKITQFCLTAADVEALHVASAALKAHNLVRDAEPFVTEAQIQSARLSAPLRRALLDFRRQGSPDGGLLIRGLPVGDLPPTPTRADLAVGATLPPAGAMSVVLAVLGDQCGFAPELGGNIIQDILPVRGFEATQQSIGATVDLLTHVEMAFLPQRSDYVALLCLRSDHERIALTTLSSVERMLPLLSPSALEILRMPRFRTTVDESFLVGSGLVGPIWEWPITAMSGPVDRPRLRVDFAETQGLDGEAQSALDELAVVAAGVAQGIALEPGDLLCIDNHRAFHGRTIFQPRYDGEDRWLLRSFITKDLSRSEDVRPNDGRVIEPVYSSPVAHEEPTAP